MANEIDDYFSGIWNAFPFEKRRELSGHTTENQLRTILSIRQMAIENHKRFLRELDSWADNVRDRLKKQIERHSSAHSGTLSETAEEERG